MSRWAPTPAGRRGPSVAGLPICGCDPARIALLAGHYRVPERARPLWTTLAAPLDGPAGQWADELARAARERQAELGQAAAIEQPAWTAALRLDVPAAGRPGPAQVRVPGARPRRRGAPPAALVPAGTAS